ncbi:MAG: hypothetical protein LBK56_04130 [Gracilibacteraceae bacterium]|jgi:hypothetical protein|nr:hypothetical protein [Gracilibacteraceae bacterium]
MKNFWRDDRGNAIPMVMIILVVGSLLVAALAVLGDTDIRIWTVNTKLQQAQYLARTGVEAAMQVYQKDVETLYPLSVESMATDMTTDTVYMKKDGTYTKDSSDPGIIGQFQVDVKSTQRDIGGGVKVDEIQFTANAVYDGVQAQQVVGAYPTLNALNAGWYDANGKVQKSKLLDQAQVKAAYNISTTIDFNPKLNGIPLIPVPDTKYDAQRLMTGLYPGYALYFPNVNTGAANPYILDGKNEYLSIDRLHAADAGSYRWPSSAVLFGAPMIFMDMPIDLRPSEADRKNQDDSLGMYYGSADHDYVNYHYGYTGRTSTYTKYSGLNEPSFTTGEATGTVGSTPFSSTNMLVLDGADIVLRGDIRLYMRVQAYYYTTETPLSPYPDDPDNPKEATDRVRRTRMYIHLGDLVLTNDSPYSYRYLKDGTLVKTPSGYDEYLRNRDKYKDPNEYGKVYFDGNVYLHVSANTDESRGKYNGTKKNDYPLLAKTLRILETYIPSTSGTTYTTTTMGYSPETGGNVSKIFGKEVYLFRKAHPDPKNNVNPKNLNTVAQLEDYYKYAGVDLLGLYLTTAKTSEVATLRTALGDSAFQFNKHTAADFIIPTNTADKEHPNMGGLAEIVWE